MRVSDHLVYLGSRCSIGSLSTTAHVCGAVLKAGAVRTQTADLLHSTARTQPQVLFALSARAHLSVLLLRYGSLWYGGAHGPFGSPRGCGSPDLYGSRCGHGSLVRFGSLLHDGPHAPFGSLKGYGSLDSFGSRCGYGSLGRFGSLPDYGPRLPIGSRTHYGPRIASGSRGTSALSRTMVHTERLVLLPATVRAIGNGPRP